MRLAPAVLLVLCGVATVGHDVAAQERRHISGLSVQGVPHPASAAIAYWDTLRLTEPQVQALREVESGIGAVLYAEYERLMVDTVARLRLWRSVPIDSGALVREFEAQVDPQLRLTLAMLRGRDETFRILSPGQRALLDSLVLGAVPLGPPLHTPIFPMHSCAEGSPGGSTRLSDRAEVIFGLRYDGDSARIVGLVVAQADGALTSSPAPLPRDPRTQPPGGGGSSGRWMILTDGESVWIDTTRVPLNGHNVLLLQGTDRVTIMPDVAGLVSLPPAFYTGGCRDVEMTEALKAHVLASPEVRAFLERRPERD